MRVWCVLGLVSALAPLTSSARGALTNFHDRESWEAAVADFTTIGFTGFPDGTFMTGQYSDLGAIFSDGNDNIILSPGFLDGAGLDGNNTIEVTFSQPMTYLAVDFPGVLRIDFSLGEQFLGTSDWFEHPSGLGGFGGVVSDEPFDRIYMFDPADGDVFIDDLHFGPPVPAPPVSTAVVLGTLWRRRRRSGR